MDNQELNSIIHDRLLPLQGKFKQWEGLAGNGFHFHPKTFRNAVESIQEVIEMVRELAKEKNDV